jgi:peptide chain release factor subunit 1
VILDDVLARLAAVEPAPTPFLSLYVNAQPDQHGRPHYEAFVRKELPARAESYPARSPERASIERDAERIRNYLARELRPAANGAALFACAGANDFFEAAQLDAPVAGHQLVVSRTPHVYPLARLVDQYRRFAILVADSHTARLFVFEGGARIEERQLTRPKVRRSAGGGWAQARYQRHLEHQQLRHAKAASEVLERVVLEGDVERIVLAGDEEVIVPVIRDQLPKQLASRVAAVLRLDIRTPEAELLRAGLEALRERDAREDAERVARLLDAYRGHGLGVVGIRATRAALDRGQVEELILTATPDRLPVAPEEAERIADGLVRAALKSGARLTFVEDAALLADIEGVGALLRYAA